MITDKSQEYTIAEDLLSYLKEDPILKDYLYKDVFDMSDQVSKISTAAGKPKGQVIVSIASPYIFNQEKEMGHIPRMEAYLVVSCLVTPNATRTKSGLNAPALLSSLLERSLTLVKRWAVKARPDVKGTYKGISTQGTMDTDFSKIPDLKNVQGKSFFVIVPFDLLLTDGVDDPDAVVDETEDSLTSHPKY